MATISYPETGRLKPLLSDLIGKDISFVTDAALPEPSDIVRQLTVYVGDDDTPLMLAGGDMSFAYFAGAALALVPKARAEDAIALNEVDEDLLENYREIMNVVTRAVNDQGGPHVRLVPGSTVDLDALPTPSDGRALGVDIAGYGAGSLAFWRL